MTKKKRRWIIYGILIVLMTIGSGFLGAKLAPWLEGWEKYGYFGVFLASFAANSTIIFPTPLMGITFPLAIGVAAQTNLFSVVLIYALGATFGEGIGYFLGWGGKKIINREGDSDYQKVGRWLKKYGKWAIFVLSFQPIIPFDIVGIVAGALKYPFWEFMIFCFLGRIPKYLILMGTGFEIWKFFFH